MWRSSNGAGEVIGLVAGQGEFPVLFAKAASSLKKKIVVFGVRGYSDKRLEDLAEQAHYIELGDLGKLVDLLKKSGIKNVVFAGSVPKREIYNPGFRMDDAAKDFMSRAGHRGDDHLLRALGAFLKLRCGVSVLDSRIFLKHMLTPKGVLTDRRPSPDEWADLKFGWKIAKGIGKLDIGQTVVVKNAAVLAVEAMEGTDSTIRRGGEIGRSGVVVVKVAKPSQDLRFDLPCVGLETLQTLKSAGSSVLGVEAAKTILISREKLIEKANSENMTLVGM